MAQYLAIQNLVFLLTGAVLLIIAFNIFLALYFLKFKKKLSLLFEGKKVKNLEEVFLNQLRKIEKQDINLKEIFEKIKKLENISEKTFQKIGMIRFNPFSDMGGNQSFVIALLDSQNNGFVISSLFIKEGNRVYTKAVKGGQSDYPLSNEEKEAIKRAIHSNS